jgi:hypothetical protein
MQISHLSDLIIFDLTTPVICKTNTICEAYLALVSTPASALLLIVAG